MKYAEFVRMNKEELEKRQRELEMELLKNAAQAVRGAGGKEACNMKKVKRDIARLKTLINNKHTHNRSIKK